MSELIAALETRKSLTIRRFFDGDDPWTFSHIEPDELLLVCDVLIAVKQAGPWPKTVRKTNRKHKVSYHECVHCEQEARSPSYLPHDADCPGVRVAAALTALEQHLLGDATTAQDGAT